MPAHQQEAKEQLVDHEHASSRASFFGKNKYKIGEKREPNDRLH